MGEHPRRVDRISQSPGQFCLDAIRLFVLKAVSERLWSVCFLRCHHSRTYRHGMAADGATSAKQIRPALVFRRMTDAETSSVRSENQPSRIRPTHSRSCASPDTGGKPTEKLWSNPPVRGRWGH